MYIKRKLRGYLSLLPLCSGLVRSKSHAEQISGIGLLYSFCSGRPKVVAQSWVPEARQPHRPALKDLTDQLVIEGLYISNQNTGW